MQYDTIIIGSGPGGYPAAIRASQLGQKTALVEKYAALGGTCLNAGCIPSKTLLDASEHYFRAKFLSEEFGVHIPEISYNWEKIQGRRLNVILDNVKGIDFLMKKNGVSVYQGLATFIDSHTINVTGGDGTSTELKSKNFIIATGSEPSTLPGIIIDKKRILTSTEALSLSKFPDSMLIIGAGVIGIELGSVYSRYGCKVTIIEYADRILPAIDSPLTSRLMQSLKKIGIEFVLGHSVKSATSSNDLIHIKAEDKSGRSSEFDGEYCLVAVGRRPNTSGIGLEKAGVAVDDRGYIKINEKMETSAAGIYAVGDVTGGLQLAHKAREEGIAAVERIAGQQPIVNYHTIPSVVYTWPELAGIGFTESDLQNLSIPYKTGKFNFRALGRARASGDLEGEIRVYAHAKTDEILGVHILGARAADMIAEAVIAMEYKATAEDIARSNHPHPTYSEALQEACLDATGKRSIHS